MLFFENLNRVFGTLGIGIPQIGLQIRTRRLRIRLYANFGKFGCISSLKNNQLAGFFLVTLYHLSDFLKQYDMFLLFWRSTTFQLKIFVYRVTKKKNMPIGYFWEK